jgi:hypothetical protein
LPVVAASQVKSNERTEQPVEARSVECPRGSFGEATHVVVLDDASIRRERSIVLNEDLGSGGVRCFGEFFDEIVVGRRDM